MNFGAFAMIFAFSASLTQPQAFFAKRPQSSGIMFHRKNQARASRKGAKPEEAKIERPFGRSVSEKWKTPHSPRLNEREEALQRREDLSTLAYAVTHKTEGNMKLAELPIIIRPLCHSTQKYSRLILDILLIEKGLI